MLTFGPNVCIFSRISFFNVANEKMEYISRPDDRLYPVNLWRSAQTKQSDACDLKEIFLATSFFLAFGDLEHWDEDTKECEFAGVLKLPYTTPSLSLCVESILLLCIDCCGSLMLFWDTQTPLSFKRVYSLSGFYLIFLQDCLHCCSK